MPNDTARLPSDDIRDHLMVQVARMAWQQDKTQTEIANETGLNRWQVSRLLQEARDQGIVRIEIIPRTHRLPDLETRLIAAFGLRDAVIVPTHAGGDGVAQAAGQYLAGLRTTGTVGVSWGRTMARVAQALPQNWAEDVTVVQINGTVAPRPQASGHNDVAETFARKGNGRFIPLPVPAVVGAKATREVLEQDRIVADVLTLARQAQVLCFGFGYLNDDSALVHSGNVLPDEVTRLLDAGAVGDLLGRFIDAQGQIADPALNDRTIGLQLDELGQRDRAIGVTWGTQKHAITLAALRAGLVNTLITDEATALHALENADDL